MKPVEFADLYYHCCVETREDGASMNRMDFVRVDQYRINRASSDYYTDVRSKNRLVQKVKKAIKSAKAGEDGAPKAADKAIIARCFMGKGAPTDYEKTLRYAVCYGGVEPDDLQTYAHDHLGLDCSGFVNQFWIQLGLINGYANSRTIRNYGQTEYRRSLISGAGATDPQAVQPGDMLIWTDFGHIALVNNLVVTPGGTQAVVVESTASGRIGPGLVKSNYELVSVDSDKKFTVKRGGINTTVYIVSFNRVS